MRKGRVGNGGRARADVEIGNLGRTDLGKIDSTSRRAASSAVKLSAEERKLLSDPDWMDEDEADLIMARRVERTQGHTAIPFEEYLKKLGRRLDR
jgi:hypothetical protein